MKSGSRLPASGEIQPVNISPKKSAKRAVGKDLVGVGFLYFFGYLEVPPSPIPSERLAGRGVRKKCLQNLDVKELRGQNLESKGLTRQVSPTGDTPRALTMMG